MILFIRKKRILLPRFTYTDVAVYMFIFDMKCITFETVATITLLIYYYPLVEAMPTPVVAFGPVRADGSRPHNTFQLNLVCV